ncbi:ribosomal protein S5 domain 2-type protein [Lophiotrema nucula]|uniref:Ribosomal RNA-processing protein 43 n=1 Tax=Lophiotrema nucula TaxID=690887 RepID=A0A6A5ZCI4_9PLEO|nr:ribosomal protein S5 domain 2-type protein [Lophiotrema nucula]
MATTTTTSQPALSFPRPIFAALSPHPFLQAHLTSTPKQPLRANGRTAHEFRSLGVNTGSLTHCNGSAVIRMGNTAVVCGVRAEILSSETGGQEISGQEDEKEDEGDEDDDTGEIESLKLLVPNIELATGSSPQHLPGQAPSAFAQTLVTRLRSLLLSSRIVRLEDLRILYTPPSNPDESHSDEEQRREVKGHWTLYIDTMFLSLDGNAFDAAWLAILAALRDTLLPHAFWDEELETILCSDDPADAHKLRLRGLPVPSTYAVFEGKSEDEEDGGVDWVLSDPDAFEESVCRETVCVVVDRSEGGMEGRLRRIEKCGGGVVDRGVMKTLVERSTQRSGVWEKVLSGS